MRDVLWGEMKAAAMVVLSVEMMARMTVVRLGAISVVSMAVAKAATWAGMRAAKWAERLVSLKVEQKAAELVD